MCNAPKPTAPYPQWGPIELSMVYPRRFTCYDLVHWQQVDPNIWHCSHLLCHVYAFNLPVCSGPDRSKPFSHNLSILSYIYKWDCIIFSKLCYYIFNAKVFPSEIHLRFLILLTLNRKYYFHDMDATIFLFIIGRTLIKHNKSNFYIMKIIFCTLFVWPIREWMWTNVTFLCPFLALPH